LRAERHPDIIQ